MADKAMLEPKYKSQLERSASGRFSGGDELIEKNMTESRHKLLMLERINNRNKWHWGRIPKEYQESIARISAVSSLDRQPTLLMMETDTTSSIRGELPQTRVEL